MMKHKLFISKAFATLLSFFMTAVAVFASETLPVKEKKPFTLNTIEDYFTDRTRTRPLLAVKTNLLFDVLATPNIEVEVPLGYNFSIMGEYWCPWWLDKYTGKCYQMLYGGLEGRYWFRNTDNLDVLHGHFLGLYAGCGLYDFGGGNGGYRGESYLNTGLTYGYSFKLNKFLRIETSLGLGVMQTKYHNYIRTEDSRYTLWQYSGKYTYFGPSKLKVSLVILFHGKDNKKGGAK